MRFTQELQLTRKCEILLVGNELLIGKTRDLNGFWLGKHVSSFGISVTRITIVRDDVDEIASILQQILKRKPNLLFISGGLGPTYDDLTMEAVAESLDRELELNEVALGWLHERYREGVRKGRMKNAGLNTARKKMALLPSNTTPLKNGAGAAPGVYIQEKNTMIFILPGVPRELQAIFKGEIAPMLEREFSDIRFHQHAFIVEDVGESSMADGIISIMKETDNRIWIKSHAKKRGKDYYVLIHVTGYGGEDVEKKVTVVAKKVKELIENLGGRIFPEEKYGDGEEEDLGI
ncbi:damage-inducible protein CinA [Candidatus Bathyarchaeota archaeon]|nr:damage-inducible protein CinA [Candidatus Bathyarchaeota archaeon]